MNPADFLLRVRQMHAETYFGLQSVVVAVVKDAAIRSRSMIGEERSEWPALAESTVTQKERLGYTGQKSATDPLLREGILRDSIDWDVTGLVGQTGSNDPVAKWQEFGTTRPSGSIPPRPFIGLGMKESAEELPVLASTILDMIFGE